ncbi:WASP-related protein [Tieghemostelium lacteum]|uniref:WASP-related protein n=1 Tax=Tieghemostelium lacteum TaxID=361077 RepID=A0A151ZDD4_TIELA|nr:WASP-related protein [Tieghemostelium lacteum]|eukprot:KYQ91894.1 WASP-related protein [Tieghemostelium lacteum]
MNQLELPLSFILSIVFFIFIISAIYCFRNNNYNKNNSNKIEKLNLTILERENERDEMIKLYKKLQKEHEEHLLDFLYMFTNNQRELILKDSIIEKMNSQLLVDEKELEMAETKATADATEIASLKLMVNGMELDIRSANGVIKSQEYEINGLVQKLNSFSRHSQLVSQLYEETMAESDSIIQKLGEEAIKRLQEFDIVLEEERNGFRDDLELVKKQFENRLEMVKLTLNDDLEKCKDRIENDKKIIKSVSDIGTKWGRELFSVAYKYHIAEFVVEDLQHKIHGLEDANENLEEQIKFAAHHLNLFQKEVEHIDQLIKSLEDSLKKTKEEPFVHVHVVDTLERYHGSIKMDFELQNRKSSNTW